MSIVPARHGVIAASRRRTPAGTPTVLGYSTLGTGSRGMTSAGRLCVSQYTLASPGTLTELHAWVATTAASQNIRVVVYADSAGAPAGRVAYSSPLAATSGSDIHVFETGLSVPITAGTYWVGWICEIAGGAMRTEPSGWTSREISSGATFTPPPATFPGGSSSSVLKLSCWAVVLV